LLQRINKIPVGSASFSLTHPVLWCEPFELARQFGEYERFLIRRHSGPGGYLSPGDQHIRIVIGNEISDIDTGHAMDGTGEYHFPLDKGGMVNNIIRNYAY